MITMNKWKIMISLWALMIKMKVINNIISLYPNKTSITIQLRKYQAFTSFKNKTQLIFCKKHLMQLIQCIEIKMSFLTIWMTKAMKKSKEIRLM